jgi:hypothetical protein
MFRDKFPKHGGASIRQEFMLCKKQVGFEDLLHIDFGRDFVVPKSILKDKIRETTQYWKHTTYGTLFLELQSLLFEP